MWIIERSAKPQFENALQIFLLSVKLARVGNLKSALMQLYGNTISLPRHRSRTASIRRRARIISRGGTDNAQIYSKSGADTKRKQKETGEVPPLTQCTRGACAYLHAVVTSADDTSAHFFFRASHIEAIRTHTSVSARRTIPAGMSGRRTIHVHTRVRSHDVWSSIPDTERYINVERKSVDRRKKTHRRAKRMKREKRNEVECEEGRKIESNSEMDRDRDRLSKGVECESEKNAKMHVTGVQRVAIRRGPNELRGVGYVPRRKEKSRKRNSDTRRERRTRRYEDERRGERRDESDECGRRLREYRANANERARRNEGVKKREGGREREAERDIEWKRARERERKRWRGRGHEGESGRTRKRERKKARGGVYGRGSETAAYVFWNKRSIRVPIVANHTLPRRTPLCPWLVRGFSSAFLRGAVTRARPRARLPAKTAR